MFGSFGTKRLALVILGTFTSLGAALAITPPRLADQPQPLTPSQADQSNHEAASPVTSQPTVTREPDCSADEPAEGGSAATALALSQVEADEYQKGKLSESTNDNYRDDDDNDDYRDGYDERDEFDNEDADDSENEDSDEDDDDRLVTRSDTTSPTTSTPATIVAAATKNPCPPTSTSSALPTPPQMPAATQAARGPALRTGNHTGNLVNTRYGPLQVKITVTDGKITNVVVPVFPSGDGRSRSISNTAIPILTTEVLRVQSAKVNAVSGASYTTEGFRASLASAIASAKI